MTEHNVTNQSFADGQARIQLPATADSTEVHSLVDRAPAGQSMQPTGQNAFVRQSSDTASPVIVDRNPALAHQPQVPLPHPESHQTIIVTTPAKRTTTANHGTSDPPFDVSQSQIIVTPASHDSTKDKQLPDTKSDHSVNKTTQPTNHQASVEAEAVVLPPGQTEKTTKIEVIYTDGTNGGIRVSPIKQPHVHTDPPTPTTAAGDAGEGGRVASAEFPEPAGQQGHQNKDVTDIVSASIVTLGGPQRLAITPGSPITGETPNTEAASLRVLEPHFETQVDYEELPWEGYQVVKTYQGYNSIEYVYRAQTGEGAITTFQKNTFEDMEQHIGVNYPVIPVLLLYELHREIEKYGLTPSPLLVTSFQSQNTIDYLTQQQNIEGGTITLDWRLRKIRKNGTGFYDNDLNIGFVNADYFDSNTRAGIHDFLTLMIHESVFHGTEHRKYSVRRPISSSRSLYYKLSKPNGEGYYPEALSEARAEWGARLIADSLHPMPTAPIAKVYFDSQKQEGREIDNTETGLDPRKLIALPSKNIYSPGWTVDYGPLATAIEMLVNRGSQPDEELFRAFLYGNVSPKAFEHLMQKLDAIDPEIKRLFSQDIDHTKRFQGMELALYMHQHMTPWTEEAVNEAAAASQRLLPTVQVETNMFAHFLSGDTTP